MLKKFFSNVRKPTNTFVGRFMLRSMNKGHEKMACWGRKFLDIKPTDIGLDIGCGGGRNLQNHLQRSDKVYGMDYSEVSVKASKELNAQAISDGKCEVVEASVEKIPFHDNQFDFITAFETIYFWPDIIKSFKEVRRVLKENGEFLICNEFKSPEKAKKWIDLIGFNVYRPNEIESMLIEAGFRNIKIYEHQNDRWMVVVACK